MSNKLDLKNVISKKWIVKGNCVNVMYLDFNKAFTLIPHDSLAKNLALHDISEVSVEWLKNWLAQRHHL